MTKTQTTLESLRQEFKLRALCTQH